MRSLIEPTRPNEDLTGTKFCDNGAAMYVINRGFT